MCQLVHLGAINVLGLITELGASRNHSAGPEVTGWWTSGNKRQQWQRGLWILSLHQDRWTWDAQGQVLLHSLLNSNQVERLHMICSESKPKIMLIRMPEVKVVPFSPTSVPLYLCAALHLCPLLSYPTHKVKHQFVLSSSYLWQKQAKQDCTDKYTFRQLIKRTLWT